MLDVEQWADIRRMKRVEGLSQREIHRRTGVHRDTIRRALRSPEAPGYGPRPRRSSKLDPYRPEIERLLEDDPTLSGVRIREQIAELGYEGSKTILDDLLHELRARYRPPPRTFQRTSYRPGELCQFDLCEPRRKIPVGWGQTRRGWMVTAELPYSRAFAAALVFSKELTDIASAMNRCLTRLGALPNAPEEAVCVDVEGAEEVAHSVRALVGRPQPLGAPDLRPARTLVGDELDRAHLVEADDRAVGGRLPVERDHALGLGTEVRVGAPLPRARALEAESRLDEQRSQPGLGQGSHAGLLEVGAELGDRVSATPWWSGRVRATATMRSRSAGVVLWGARPDSQGRGRESRAR